MLVIYYSFKSYIVIFMVKWYNIHKVPQIDRIRQLRSVFFDKSNDFSGTCFISSIWGGTNNQSRMSITWRWKDKKRSSLMVIGITCYIT